MHAAAGLITVTYRYPSRLCPPAKGFDIRRIDSSVRSRPGIALSRVSDGHVIVTGCLARAHVIELREA